MTGPAHPTLDRSRPPAPGQIVPFSFPPFLRRRLANGLQVVAARSDGAPVVDLRLLAPAGAAWNPPGQAGLASLTAGLLDEGTTGRSAMDIARSVEGLGGNLSTSADWDVGSLSAHLLVRHLSAGLDLLTDLLLEASFPPSEVERVRGRRLADLLRRRDSPGRLADDVLARAIYGEAVYGAPLPGTPESVRRLERDVILGFFRQHYPPSATILVAAGDLDPEGILRHAEARLGGIPSRPAPALPEIAPARLPGIVVHLVDRPGSTQTELRLGHVGVPRSHPDWIGLSVVNSILGGKFTSRINLNLRERHGYTYGAASSFAARRGPGPFVLATAVATESTGAAVGECLQEIRRLREEPVAGDELEDTQRYLIGVFPYTLQTSRGLANRLETLAVVGLADDYYDRFPEAVRALDGETLTGLAQRHLDPEHLAVVAVGAVDRLRPQLERFGPVTVHTLGRPDD